MQDIDILNIFQYVFIVIICVLIIRLIYEFIVIPISVSNSRVQVYQQNVYAGQANQNIPYTQQNYTMPQNQTASYVQPQQPEQGSIAPESQFKFCSQCGTRYDAVEDNCPNCGMK